MSKLIDIHSQIEQLKKQAELIRSKEFASTVAEIREKMKAFGITVKDLQGPNKVGRKVKAVVRAKSKRSSPNAGSKVEAKYKGPNGESWTGRGLTPKWLTSLIASGRSKEEFSVKAETSSIE